MFKNYFKKLGNKIHEVYATIKNSKVVNVIKKVGKAACYSSIILTAYNLGNITEALAHMNDAPTGFADTARWFMVLCRDFIGDIKAKNFTWEVKRLFVPFVTAATYIGTKILGKIKNIVNWFRKASKAMEKPETANTTNTEVVNLFA